MEAVTNSNTDLSRPLNEGEERVFHACQGTCSKAIEVTARNGIIENVTFYGGCNGNTKGISQLVCGMKVDDVIARLKGTTCGARPTSCPDQLSRALEKLKAES